METWDAIRSRRNVRVYTDDPIPAADLERILEAGRIAPSSGNRQPWDFVVCTDRNTLQRLTKVWRGAGHIAGSAATIVVVGPVADDAATQASIRHDLAQATMAMMIAAADVGIGSGHAAVRDQELAREILGFPADRYADLMIGLGYPADRPLRPIANFNRRPMDDLLHDERW